MQRGAGPTLGSQRPLSLEGAGVNRPAYLGSYQYQQDIASLRRGQPSQGPPILPSTNHNMRHRSRFSSDSERFGSSSIGDISKEEATFSEMMAFTSCQYGDDLPRAKTNKAGPGVGLRHKSVLMPGIVGNLPITGLSNVQGDCVFLNPSSRDVSILASIVTSGVPAKSSAAPIFSSRPSRGSEHQGLSRSMALQDIPFTSYSSSIVEALSASAKKVVVHAGYSKSDNISLEKSPSTLHQTASPVAMSNEIRTPPSTFCYNIPKESSLYDSFV